MTMPIETDQRYRVTQEAVDEMRELRKEGWSCYRIARKFGVSYHTAYYWVNEDYRQRKQLKNAKRKPDDPKEHSKNQTARVKRYWSDAKFRQYHYLDSALHEKRSRRIKVLGEEISALKNKIDEEFKKGGQKVV